MQHIDNLVFEPNVTLKSTNEKKTQAKCKNRATNQNSDKFEQGMIEVKARLNQGCDCNISCYRGLKTEAVYKHRLNIAELSKSEHDMYLMGVTMASICDPTETSRHKERRRLRASYVYQGRKVCLDAFLYLENVTHYQLKRIRKHVMTHGVIPRVHGNIGKKPYNSFNLETYQYATKFIKSYIESNFHVKDYSYRTLIIQGDTRKNIYDHYLEHGKANNPGTKLMGYSTFRHFIKKQFSNIKFTKLEKKESCKLDVTKSNKEVQSNFENEDLVQELIDQSTFDQPKLSDIQTMPIVMMDDNIEFVVAQVAPQIFQSTVYCD